MDQSKRTRAGVALAAPALIAVLRRVAVWIDVDDSQRVVGGVPDVDIGNAVSAGRAVDLHTPLS